eukprot:TRINITY_DN15801_c0_g1_i2.p1 TRINITY_DN15801_c0_g1~~TRINITY_DN15801_c0_g1_i2.p1  ORF type:complete len:573 (+),score=46.47 TRINITY_DN15801_c0_g1_i2:231-1949(+)
MGLRKGDGVGAQGRANISFLAEMGSMSMDECRRRCPGLVVRPMRTERYRQVGALALRLLEQWQAPVEKTSYDDFYVDVTKLAAADSAATTCLPSSARVYGDIDHEVAFDSLPRDLQIGSRIGMEMRAKLRSELALVASVGVGRSKFAARMLSPRAKPDGMLILPDTASRRFYEECCILDIPSYQGQHGRQLAELLLGMRPAQGTAPDMHDADTGMAVKSQQTTRFNILKSIHLGEVVALGRAKLIDVIGQVDADKLLRLADGNDGNAVVKPRGPPKTLASEASFPPTDDPNLLRSQLFTLSETLVKRLVSDGLEHGQRSPAKLTVTWRQGYAAIASSSPSLSTTSTTKGVQHSRSVPWPASSSSRPTNSIGADCSSDSLAEKVTEQALKVLIEATRAPRQITRLIVGVAFAASIPQVGRASSGQSSLLASLRLQKEGDCRKNPPSQDSDTPDRPRAPELTETFCKLTYEDVDMAAIAALPKDIREEVERELELERRARPARNMEQFPASARAPSASLGTKRKSASIAEMLFAKRPAIVSDRNGHGVRNEEIITLDETSGTPGPLESIITVDD